MSVSTVSYPDKWTSAFNPAILAFNREDFDIDSVSEVLAGENAGKTVIGIGEIVGDEALGGDMIYVYLDNHTSLAGYYEVLGIQAGTIVIDLDYTYIGETDTGFANVYKDYYIDLQLSLGNTGVVYAESFFSGRINETTGFYEIKADISKMLLKALSKLNVSDYSEFCIAETALSTSYKYRYAEVWGNMVGDPSFSSWYGSPYRLVASAMRLKHERGGGLNNHMVSHDLPRFGKFLTGFEKPQYIPGLPFDLSIIYDGTECEPGVSTLYFVEYELDGSELKRTVIDSGLNDNVIRIKPSKSVSLPTNINVFQFTSCELLDHTSQNYYVILFGSILPAERPDLAEGTVKIISSNYPEINGYYEYQGECSWGGNSPRWVKIVYGSPTPPGYEFSPRADDYQGYVCNEIYTLQDMTKSIYANIIIDTAGAEYMGSESIELEVVQYCQGLMDNAVYLCWINKWGGWDYWLFTKTYSEEVDISNEDYGYYIEDYETGEGFSDVTNIKSVEQYTIGADNLTDQQIAGLKELLSSPRVMMLMNLKDYYNYQDFSPSELPEWTIVKVAGGSVNTKQSSFDGRHSLEFSIRLQDVTTQNY